MRRFLLPALLMLSAGAAPVQTHTLQTPQHTLTLKQTFDYRLGMSASLTASRRPDGRRLWQKQLYKNHVSFAVTLMGTLGNAVLVGTGGGDVHWPDVTAYDLTSGAQLWKASGEILGQASGKVLLISPGVGDPNLNEPPSQIPLTRAGSGSRKGDQPQFFHLVIPPRPGCGSARYQGGFPDLNFTRHFLYALRQDRCGKFIARFDWQGSADQRPLVYPDRRPAAP